MHVSVVICTRNRPDLIGAALDSVLANTYPAFDVVVIDQSDDDRTGQEVKRTSAAHPNLRYIHSTTPGLSRAYNRGIRESRGELLAFTDDDCIAPPDWIARIVRAFESDVEAELLYGQVLRPAALAHSVDHLPTLSISSAQRLTRGDDFKICGMGANFAARRRLFERVGLFDEVLGGGGPLKSSQDFDLQYRAYVAGAVVVLRPEVWVDHYGVRSDAVWPATERAYGIGDGAFYFKHVRCGDTFALWLLARRLVVLTTRDTARALLRRRGHWEYIRSIFRGILMSRHYVVDRRTRLYELPA
jgi:glycosyltransferase involved in cell wall biosynthesis